MTEPRTIAVVMRDPGDLHRALRERAEQLDISREAIDELAGLPKGYAAKLLCEPPVRLIGPTSFFPLAGALGYAVALIEDERSAVVPKRAAKRKPGGPRGSDGHPTRALVVFRAMGLKGALAALKSLSPEEISRQRSRAAKARWRKWRKAKKAAKQAISVSALIESEK